MYYTQKTWPSASKHTKGLYKRDPSIKLEVRWADVPRKLRNKSSIVDIYSNSMESPTQVLSSYWKPKQNMRQINNDRAIAQDTKENQYSSIRSCIGWSSQPYSSEVAYRQGVMVLLKKKTNGKESKILRVTESILPIALELTGRQTTVNTLT